MSDWIDVAPAQVFPPGTSREIDIDGTPVAIFNLDGRYYAIENICTHDGGPLAEGEVEDHEVICPRHGARFDIRTGAALTMPAVTPVDSYPVRVEGNELYIGLPD